MHPTRRLPVLLTLLAAACGDGAETVPAPEPPVGLRAAVPNAIVIVMDTCRADRCSFNGYGRPTTPRLEAFAADSVTFTNAWAPSYWTPPSHATLFTGLLPGHHGLWVGNREHLLAHETTVAERFAAAGHATAAFVDNPQLNPFTGLLRGFQRQVMTFARDDAEQRRPRAAETLAEALTWVREARTEGRGFFLFVNHMEPHAPYRPPDDRARAFVSADVTDAELAAGYTHGFADAVRHNFGPERLSTREVALLSDLYDAEIATLDDALGDFLDALTADGALAETVVVITSDHGEAFDEHGLLDHMANVHRQALHVPLVVRSPEHFRGGRREDAVVRLEDVLPTVLELCGLPAVDEIDGRSLTGELSGRVALGFAGRPSRLLGVVRRELPTIDVSPWDHALFSAYDGRHHLVARGDGRVRLYDLGSDPDEQTDRAAALPEVVERLSRLLDPLRAITTR